MARTTNAPRIDAEFRRQRLRWIRGGLQALWNHRAMLGSRALGIRFMIQAPMFIVEKTFRSIY